MLHICGEHAEKKKTPAGQETSSPAEGAATDGDVTMDGDAAAASSTTPADGASTTADPIEAPILPGAAAPATENADAEADSDEPAQPLKHQAVAVIGIALIAMGEDVGAEMALRQFQYLVSHHDRKDSRRS
jgi:26S proteasome regulatory subunit N1